MSLIIDVIDQQDDVVFVGGTVLDDDLTSGAVFSALVRYQGRQNNRQVYRAVDLTVTTLIHDGEPVDTAQDGDEVLVGLTGDASPLIEAAQEAGWRRKQARYFRTTDTTFVLE